MKNWQLQLKVMCKNSCVRVMEDLMCAKRPRARNFVFVPESRSHNWWRLVNIRRGRRVASVYYEMLD